MKTAFILIISLFISLQLSARDIGQSADACSSDQLTTEEIPNEKFLTEVVKYSNELGLPAEDLLALMYHESGGLVVGAYNASSRSVGLNQQVPSETKAFYPEFAHLENGKRQIAIKNMKETYGEEGALLKEFAAVKRFFNFYIFGEGKLKGKHNPSPIPHEIWDKVEPKYKIGIMYNLNAIGTWNNYSIKTLVKQGKQQYIPNILMGARNPNTKNPIKNGVLKSNYEGNPTFSNGKTKDTFTIADLDKKVHSMKHHKKYKPWKANLDLVIAKLDAANENCLGATSGARTEANQFVPQQSELAPNSNKDTEAQSQQKQ